MNMEPTTPANMTPAEIDAELARLSNIEWTAWRSADEYRRLAARKTVQSAGFETQAEKQEAIAAAARKEARPFHNEYANRGRWNRYFLATNANGHVHRGMNCGTCYQTTEYAWLVDLADCDEAAMVAEYGEMACAVCFPDAPTHKGFGDGTSTLARRTQAERDAKAAAKAAQAAEKAAKAITARDGSPLRVGGSVVATKVAAQRKLSDAVQNLGWYGVDHPSDFVGQVADLAAALGAAGIDPQPIIKRAMAKAIKDGAAKFPAGVGA